MNKEFFARKKDINELQINKANASDVYTKEEVINKITEKVSEIVADAPEDFDTLKEMSDWINNHEGSAAEMNTAINTNKTDIANIQTILGGKVDKEEGKSLISDSEIARLANIENYDDTQIKNSIALNRTTLGVQCKNLFDWKNAVAARTNNITYNKTKSDILVTSTGPWSIVAYKLPTLKVGANYVFSTVVSNFSAVSNAIIYIMISTSTSSSDIVRNVKINGNGNYTNEFTATSDTMYVLFIPNSSSTSYTNSFTASDIMLRYADITDNTYEPYKESVDERLINNTSDIAINRTTIGYQCKNLHDTLSVNWYQPGKTSVASDGTVTATITSDTRNFTYANSEHYITLEAGNYIITVNTLEFVSGSAALIRGCNSDNQSLFALSVSSAGLHEAAFSLSKKTTIGIMYKLYSQTCTIMIRDADILDDTYEPYKENVNKRLIKNKSDIAVNKTTLGIQCKNLFKLSHPFGYKYTNAGGTATWTFNNDYSVSMIVNSQISSGVAIPISEVTLKKGSYIYSVEGYSTPNITHTQLYSLNADGSWTWLANLSAIENKITVTEETTYSFRAYRNSLVTVGVIETLYPMLRYSDITDSTFEPYKENIDGRLIQNKSDIAVNKTTLGTQCKNLLRNETGNTVMGGLTFTHNSDGSVTINGTSDGQYFYTLMSKDFENILGKKCILTGCPANGSNSTFGIYIRTDIDDYIYDSGAGVTFTTDSIIWINIVVRSGVTFDNVTFYPMLRYADILDDTYEPYSDNVDTRLIENKSNTAINKSTLGYQCKNLLKNNAVTQTISGVTFTINDDKSITVNGTATAQISFRISNKVGLGIGNYILTGCPSGGSNNTFYLTAYASSAWLSAPDFGSGCKIENKTVTHVVISIASGYTANNLKFYPMLRYADIIDNTYEPYQPSLQEQINQLSDTSNSGKLLYSMSEVVSSPLTVNITGLFTAYTVVVCNVVTSNGKHSLTLPLKYIKSLGTSAFYDAEGILFYYVDDNKITISTGLGQNNPTINTVKIISLF